MAETAIKLENVTKRYGSARGIDNVSLNVKRGEVFGFLGPNGAGKTTTIRTILDFIRPTEGKITVLGLDSQENYIDVHKKIGYLTGEMEMDAKLTGRQFLEYMGNLHGGFHEQRVRGLAEKLQCDLSRKIKHLSRGNRQKVGLIAALMQDPEILVLDEPTSGLDPLIQAQFNTIIREHAAKGRTAFISSHILSEVQNICDRVGFIREGRLMSVSTLSDLLSKSFKRVVVTFASKDMAAKFKLAGAENLSVKGRTVTFDYKEGVDQLIKVFAGYKLDDLSIEQLELEDLFMQYYQKEKQDV